MNNMRAWSLFFRVVFLFLIPFGVRIWVFPYFSFVLSYTTCVDFVIIACMNSLCLY